MSYNTIKHHSIKIAGSNSVEREPTDPWINSLRDDEEPSRYVRKDPSKYMISNETINISSLFLKTGRSRREVQFGHMARQKEI